MTPKKVIQYEIMKVSGEIVRNDHEQLALIIKKIYAMPIKMKDKRRNPNKYKVSTDEVDFCQHPADFEKDIYTIVRKIVCL